MTTIADIATRAGVSAFTVSKVLSGQGAAARISAARRAQVERIAQELGYRRNAAAGGLRAGRAGLVGVVLRQRAADPFRYLAGFEYVLGLNLRLEQAGLGLVLLRIDDLEREREPRLFREALVDGLVVIDAMPVALERRIAGLGLPTVWLDAGVWRAQGCVRRDEAAAGRLAAQALVDGGCRALVWCGAVPRRGDHYSLHQRHAAVAAVAKAARLPLTATGYYVGVSDRDARAWLRPGAGVVAYDTLHAQWLAHTAARLGLAPGRDIGLACCDGTSETALTWPQLARAAADRHALGGLAAEDLLAHLAAPTRRPASRLAPVTWVAGNTARIGIAP